MMHSAKQHPPFPSPSPTLSILFPFGPAATINSTNDLPHRGQGSIKNAHSLGHTASRGRPEAGREATPEPSCTFTLPDCKPSHVEVRKNHTFNPPPRDVLISVCVCLSGRDKGRRCESHVMGVLPAAKSMQGARWGVRCFWDPDKTKDTTQVDGERWKPQKWIQWDKNRCCQWAKMDKKIDETNWKLGWKELGPNSVGIPFSFFRSTVIVCMDTLNRTW